MYFQRWRENRVCFSICIQLCDILGSQRGDSEGAICATWTWVPEECEIARKLYFSQILKGFFSFENCSCNPYFFGLWVSNFVMRQMSMSFLVEPLIILIPNVCQVSMCSSPLVFCGWVGGRVDPLAG